MRFALVFALAAVACACAPRVPLEPLRARAASDLRCTELGLVDVEADTAPVYLVTGCGRRGYYEYRGGTWEPLRGHSPAE